MSDLNKEINTFNTSVLSIAQLMKGVDIEKMPKDKRTFYESVIALTESAVAILEAKQQQIIWLEQCNEKSKDIAYKQLHKEFIDLLSLARGKGVDGDLIRYA